MNYLKLKLESAKEKDNDILVAYLSDYEFNGFDEEDGALIAYIGEKDYNEALAKTLESLEKQFELTISTATIVDQNWNAKWESDYQPVFVDDFCAVRATFHEAITTVEHEIVVTPKMSFGTGHHATTYMMMKQMQSIDFAQKTVFDYGCGTCVLAILAIKLGAVHADAIDIDHWAYENSLENVDMNRCKDEIAVFCGAIEAAPDKQYDVVLANINRNVILDTMPGMAKRLNKGGLLLTSGFLEEDISLVQAKAEAEGLVLKTTLQREKWRCLVFEA